MPISISRIILWQGTLYNENADINNLPIISKHCEYKSHKNWFYLIREIEFEKTAYI